MEKGKFTFSDGTKGLSCLTMDSFVMRASSQKLNVVATEFQHIFKRMIRLLATACD